MVAENCWLLLSPFNSGLGLSYWISFCQHSHTAYHSGCHLLCFPFARCRIRELLCLSPWHPRTVIGSSDAACCPFLPECFPVSVGRSTARCACIPHDSNMVFSVMLSGLAHGTAVYWLLVGVSLISSTFVTTRSQRANFREDDLPTGAVEPQKRPFDNLHTGHDTAVRDTTCIRHQIS